MKTFLRSRTLSMIGGTESLGALRLDRLLHNIRHRDVVDIIIQFDSSNERQVCICRDRLRKIREQLRGILPSEAPRANMVAFH